ncbi:hypothetical protein A2U01_0084005, partial [Trifolium medium]|nr:hypothetical protein [Trifolium medium]
MLLRAHRTPLLLHKAQPAEAARGSRHIRALRQPLLRCAPTPSGSPGFSLTSCYRDFKAHSTI